MHNNKNNITHAQTTIAWTVRSFRQRTMPPTAHICAHRRGKHNVYRNIDCKSCKRTQFSVIFRSFCCDLFIPCTKMPLCWAIRCCCFVHAKIRCVVACLLAHIHNSLLLLLCCYNGNADGKPRSVNALRVRFAARALAASIGTQTGNVRVIHIHAHYAITMIKTLPIDLLRISSNLCV